MHRFSNSLLGVRYPDETLSLVFDILHDNWSYASFFPTLLSVLDIVLESQCLSEILDLHTLAETLPPCTPPDHRCCLIDCFHKHQRADKIKQLLLV